MPTSKDLIAHEAQQLIDTHLPDTAGVFGYTAPRVRWYIDSLEISFEIWSKDRPDFRVPVAMSGATSVLGAFEKWVKFF